MGPDTFAFGIAHLFYYSIKIFFLLPPQIHVLVPNLYSEISGPLEKLIGVKTTMKFLSNKHLNKLGKSTLAMVLAGSVVFSAPLAFAAEETTEGDTYQTVDLADVTSTDENTTVDSNTVDVTTDSTTDVEGSEQPTDVEGSEETATDVEATEEGSEETANPDEQLEDEEEAPSLVPGDLFYFIKIALEKIKLAITIDDVKEAKLLATYAAERLAEADVLFAEGKEAEALEVIEHALEYLGDSEAIVDENTQAEDVDQNTNEDGTEAEENEVAVEEDNATGEEEEEEAVVEENEAAEDTEAVKAVKQLISQNIIALSAAMKKVKNETAKAALHKNIEKSEKKLAKKMIN